MEKFIIFATIFFQKTLQSSLPCLRLKGENHKDLHKLLKSLNLSNKEFNKKIDNSSAKGIIMSSWRHNNGTEFYLVEYKTKRDILKKKFNFHRDVLGQALEDKKIDFEVKCYQSKRAGYFTLKRTQSQLATYLACKRINWQDSVNLLKNLIETLKYYSSLGGFFTEINSHDFKLDALDFSKPILMNFIKLESFNSIIYISYFKKREARVISLRTEPENKIKPEKKFFRVQIIKKWDKHTMLNLLKSMILLLEDSKLIKSKKHIELLNAYSNRIWYQILYIEYYPKYNIEWEHISSDLQEGLPLNIDGK